MDGIFQLPAEHTYTFRNPIKPAEQKKGSGGSDKSGGSLSYVPTLPLLVPIKLGWEKKERGSREEKEERGEKLKKDGKLSFGEWCCRMEQFHARAKKKRASISLCSSCDVCRLWLAVPLCPFLAISVSNSNVKRATLFRRTVGHAASSQPARWEAIQNMARGYKELEVSLAPPHVTGGIKEQIGAKNFGGGMEQRITTPAATPPSLQQPPGVDNPRDFRGPALKKRKERPEVRHGQGSTHTTYGGRYVKSETEKREIPLWR